MAEHMLIMGVEDPRGKVSYLAAAFPSACGKTNLAMLVPPEPLRIKGYKIWMVGDDIAWIRVGDDGRLWAVNPENGLFGVAPGTNCHTNPNGMATIRKDTIFTNVLLTDDGNVWWEDGEGEAPAEGTAWDGSRWKPGSTDHEGKPIKGAHPNSRFTAPLINCPIASPQWENPRGVPLSAIVFGGRCSKKVPLVFEAFNWNHGVYVGATMSSELTAAQFGKLGKVRHDPMAMLPFCGYNMGDYFAHWLKMGQVITKPPKIFHVNWFRRDAEGNFLWPGFGENLRVLNWILQRAEGQAGAIETPLGYMPGPGDLDLEGLDLDQSALTQLFEVNRSAWLKDEESNQLFFDQFESRLPSELLEESKALIKRLEKLTG